MSQNRRLVLLCAVVSLLGWLTACDRSVDESTSASTSSQNEAAAAQPPPSTRPEPQGVRIGRRAPAVGDTVQETSTFEMHVLVQHVIDDDGGPSFERHSLDHTVKRTTVLAVAANGAVTEADVTYDTRTATLEQDGQTHAADSPLVGRTYRITAVAGSEEAEVDDEIELVIEYRELTDDEDAADEDAADDASDDDDDEVAGSPSHGQAAGGPATTAAGRLAHAAQDALVSAITASALSDVAERTDEEALLRLPPADELIEVRRDNHGIGQLDALREMLPPGELAPGTPTPMVREHVARLFSQGTSEAEVEVATLQLDRVRHDDAGRRVADLTTDLTVRVDDGDTMSMRLVLSGELVVQLETGWIDSMNLSGDVETAGQIEHGDSITRMTGSGTVEMIYEAAYETASP